MKVCGQTGYQTQDLWLLSKMHYRLLHNAVMRSIEVDGMQNSDDPDQMAPQEPSDLGLHCLISQVCPNL